LPLLRAILEHQNPDNSDCQWDQSRVKGIEYEECKKKNLPEQNRSIAEPWLRKRLSCDELQGIRQGWLNPKYPCGPKSENVTKIYLWALYFIPRRVLGRWQAELWKWF
jgi:hypothetical protein